MSHKLSPEEQHQLAVLHEFQNAVWAWHHGDSENPRQLRSAINQNLQKVKQIVADAGCETTLTISLPPAVGGMIMRDVDPFDIIFNPPYRQSLISVVSDIIDQTIAVIERGELTKKSDPKTSNKKEARKGDSRSVFVVHG
jgi:hypothetical protein